MKKISKLLLIALLANLFIGCSDAKAGLTCKFRVALDASKKEVQIKNAENRVAIFGAAGDNMTVEIPEGKMNSEIEVSMDAIAYKQKGKELIYILET